MFDADDFDVVQKKPTTEAGSNAVGSAGIRPLDTLGGKPVYFKIKPTSKPYPSNIEKKSSTNVDLKTLLTEMIRSEASDLHLTVGVPPCIRVDGEIYKMFQYAPLKADKVQQLTYSVLKDKQKKEFEQNNELDFSFGVPKLSRFRANIFKQRGNIACAFRAIPFEILEFEKLGLPSAVKEFVNMPKGLILVTGPTGSGKSTTLASMIKYISQRKKHHIITIEDPIEYTFKHGESIVNQRQIGEDTVSFPIALKYVLREDPDVIMIGEMRDLDTIEAALTIAETGHLVFATLHTNSTIESINRIIDVFPPHQQQQVRTQLAFVVQGIMTQQLIKRASGRGRIMIAEVLVPTPAIRSMMRENKLHQIYSALQTGKKYSMQTMNEALTLAVKKGQITRAEAEQRSMNKDELKNLFQHYGV
ncbi:PilT/PilU family type 4a pilus ATPase [bacterium]|nr:PilT/PilU family type 4a pilus ATPase [bacterium]